MLSPTNNPPTIRVVLVEDHAIFRQGLVSLFADAVGIEIVGEATGVADAAPLLTPIRPTWRSLTLSLPDGSGLAVVANWRGAGNRPAAVMLTSNRDPAKALEAANQGIEGYVLKDDVFDDLERAVREVHAGRRYYSAGVSDLLVGHHADPTPTITDRERQVLEAVAQGDTNRRIASQLDISVKTVETHRAKLMDKLEVRGAAELVRVAIERGLITIDRPVNRLRRIHRGGAEDAKKEEAPRIARMIRMSEAGRGATCDVRPEGLLCEVFCR